MWGEDGIGALLIASAPGRGGLHHTARITQPRHKQGATPRIALANPLLLRGWSYAELSSSEMFGRHVSSMLIACGLLAAVGSSGCGSTGVLPPPPQAST